MEPLSPVEATLATMLYALGALFLLFVVVNLRHADLTQAAIITLMYGLSLQYTRCIDDAARMTFSFLAASASTSVTTRRRASALPLHWVPLLGVGLLGLSTSVVIDPEVRGVQGQIGVGVDSRAPRCAVAFVARTLSL